LYSWWWVRLSPETCRVKPLRIKNAIVASWWRSVFPFRSQNGSTSKKVWEPVIVCWLIVHHFFKDAFSISECIATNSRVNSEWRIGNNLEGSGLGLPQVPIQFISGGTERITIPFSMLKCLGRVSSQASPEFKSVLERTYAGSL